MKQLLSFLLTLSFLTFPLAGIAKKGIYDITIRDAAGVEHSLKQYKGKVMLIVNTATRCGFTPQYSELQALYERFAPKGLVILDFPCNQFGEQAPGTIDEIHDFCTLNFKISFPQMDKVDVNGPDASSLFSFLKAEQPFRGFNLQDKTGKYMDQMLRKQDPAYDQNADIKWNFTKFLVDRKGRVLRRFEPTESMQDIVRAIQELIK